MGLSRSNFLSSKNEKNAVLNSFLYFHKLRKLLTFQEKTYKAAKTNKKSAPKKFLVYFDVFVIFTAVKYREIPCDYLYSAVKHREIPCD